MVAAYLKAVQDEAVRRGYKFNASKIGRQRFRGKSKETRGQLLYEWQHLKQKLKRRDPNGFGNLSRENSHPASAVQDCVRQST